MSADHTRHDAGPASIAVIGLSARAGEHGADLDFFGQATKEAGLLVLCWEALEVAGIVPAGRIGVFLAGDTEPELLGLAGPSATASDGPAAVELACASLRRGEAAVAVAGDGKAVLVLKPLDRALADGDRVRGVLAGPITDDLADLVANLVPVAGIPKGRSGRTTFRTATTAWAISGHTAAALRAQADLLRAHLAGTSHPADVGLSLALTRTDFDHRAVLLGETHEELAAELSALAEGLRGTRVGGVARPRERVVFVFPGQGSQWSG
ncbi:MAG TPA: hypothetical protein VNP92_21250, partial [Actinophytocola sp.]|nr:hypothetical protein [Actinophytocola sp.]